MKSKRQPTVRKRTNVVLKFWQMLSTAAQGPAKERKYRYRYIVPS